MHLTVNKPSRCIMARIHRQGKLYQKNFFFSAYPSKQATKADAAKWVAKMLKVLPPPSSSRDMMTRRNKSGVVGVRLAKEVQKKDTGKKYTYFRWVAHWPGCAYHGGVSWSTEQHGDKDAFVLAVLSRRSENANRKQVLAELDKIRNTAKYNAILKLKKAAKPGAKKASKK